LIGFGLDEAGEISQRTLPAEIARFHRNGVGKTFLHDVQLGADGYLLERHRHLDFARQVGILESVGVAQALAGSALYHIRWGRTGEKVVTHRREEIDHI
jgi:hypothetical protein